MNKIKLNNGKYLQFDLNKNITEYILVDTVNKIVEKGKLQDFTQDIEELASTIKKSVDADQDKINEVKSLMNSKASSLKDKIIDIKEKYELFKIGLVTENEYNEKKKEYDLLKQDYEKAKEKYLKLTK